MTKRVLDVGNCDHDHGQIKRMLEAHFDADVIQVRDGREALERLQEESFDLITVNRLIDWTGEDGLDVIRTLQADEQLRLVPVMMITNYPDHQELAIQAGAVPGFGKKALGTPQTLASLRNVLG